MVRAACVALLLGLGWLSACSGKTVGDESGDGGEAATAKPPPKPSPVKACQTYASTWCTKAFACYVKVGRLDEASRKYNVDQCNKLIVERLPCSATTSVGSSFDQCISNIKGMACSQWDVPQASFGTVVPPSSCDDALGFDE